MKEKFWKWYNTPITWGASLKVAIWGTVIYAIGCITWLFGYGASVRYIREFRQRMKLDAKTNNEKTKYYEVSKDVEE